MNSALGPHLTLFKGYAGNSSQDEQSHWSLGIFGCASKLYVNSFSHCIGPSCTNRLACSFRSVYIETEDGSYGSTQTDGTMNGMIGKLATNKADAAIHGLGIFDERAKWAEPLSPITTYE